ncbi:hypothetical protein MLD38_002071 [Melastoma candidum]|uniref:Uncharacterized protein n=1 Tax=Melastoma candidum TaxID=119954 RepID=A0ACB9SIK8_9MYRT|nr:hypothetical protein MLD38_002071 [Melastoma candidum]
MTARRSNVLLVQPRGADERLRDIFKAFDVNCDGVLSRKELQKALKYLGAIFPDFKAGRCMHHCDENGDGRIDELELDVLVIYASRCGYKVK